MKVVKPNAVYIASNNKTPYEVIEKIGRTCYKSEEFITPGSAVKFVQAMAKNKHYAMLEHYNLIFFLNAKGKKSLFNLIQNTDPSAIKFFNITCSVNYAFISGSFRSWLELFDKIDLIPTEWLVFKWQLQEKYPEIFGDVNKENKFIAASLDFDNLYDNSRYYTRDDLIDFLRRSNTNEAKFIAKNHLTHTVIFTCDRGVSHEFVRHRPASFAQESTRYCNYSKDKFGNEITVIKPIFFEEGSDKYNLWKESIEVSEKKYFELLEAGATAQEARDVLPNSLKTEIVITATESEWQHIIDLRLKGVTGKPHPQMVEVMELAKTDLINNSFSLTV